jgi:predicted ATPase
LHPYAVTILGDLLKTASHQVQVIVSTQSASLVSAIDQPESVIVLDRTGRLAGSQEEEKENLADLVLEAAAP